MRVLKTKSINVLMASLCIFALQIAPISNINLFGLGQNYVVAFSLEDVIDKTSELESGNLSLASGDYALSNLTTSNSITIESGATVNLAIINLTITAASASPIAVSAGATLNLTVLGDNTLTAGKGHAGISVDPAYYDEEDDWYYLEDDSAFLNISGDGNLTATGGVGTSSYGSGAGIGGNGQNFDGAQGGVDIGTITITEDFSGKIVAAGGKAVGYNYGGGAGIGTGGANAQNYYWGEIYGVINILSGTIDARGGDEPALDSEAGGAGIGGGGAAGGATLMNYMTINISDGEISALSGGSAAGIGGGGNCDGGEIYISGGNIRATLIDNGSSFSGAAIGGGDNAAFTLVDISGGTVIADSHNRASAGIGFGTYAAFGILEEGQEEININIHGSDTVVYAYGGTLDDHGGAGIGLGGAQWPREFDHFATITITDGASVYAYAGVGAQAIGYSNKLDPNLYNAKGIKLNFDDSITLWAVNQDYTFPALTAYQQKMEDSIDVSHSDYVSTERYLVTYTNYDQTDTNLTSGDSVGSLTAPEEYSTEYPLDATISWRLEGDYLYVEFDGNIIESVAPIYYPFANDPIVGHTAFHGNWATLAPAIVEVSYEFVGNYPDGVTPPEHEFIAKGSGYVAKQQTPTEYEDWAFDGWYTDEDCTQKLEDGTVLSEATKLYGKWTKNGSKNPDVPVDPDTPVDPVDPTEPNLPDTPKTLDESNAALWIALVAVSVFGLIVAIVIIRKNLSKEE